jgi:hypothetical protein
MLRNDAAEFSFYLTRRPLAWLYGAIGGELAPLLSAVSRDFIAAGHHSRMGLSLTAPSLRNGSAFRNNCGITEFFRPKPLDRALQRSGEFACLLDRSLELIPVLVCEIVKVAAIQQLLEHFFVRGTMPVHVMGLALIAAVHESAIGHKADIPARSINVRFRGQRGDWTAAIVLSHFSRNRLRRHQRESAKWCLPRNDPLRGSMKSSRLAASDERGRRGDAGRSANQDR